MGLSSFWSSLTTPKVREISPHKQRQPFPDQRPATSAGVTSLPRPRLPELPAEVPASFGRTAPLPSTTAGDRKAQRSSRRLSLSRSKTTDDLSARRQNSPFGARPTLTQDIPDVPSLPAPFASIKHSQQSSEEWSRPGTAITISDGPSSNCRQYQSEFSSDEDERSARKSRRKSLSLVLNRRRTKSHAPESRRKAHASNTSNDEPLPPVPAIPFNKSTRPSQPSTAPMSSTVEPQIRRRRISSASSKPRPRRSSSRQDTALPPRPSSDYGADDGDDESEAEQEEPFGTIPPLPSLVRSSIDSPSSSRTPSSVEDHFPAPPDAHPLRRVSTTLHGAYVPSRCGKPFPATAVVAPNDAHNFHPRYFAGGRLRSLSSLTPGHYLELEFEDDVDPSAPPAPTTEADLAFLDVDRQTEWESLRELMDVMVHQVHYELDAGENVRRPAALPPAPEAVGSAGGTRSKYENADALARLELGVAK